MTSRPTIVHIILLCYLLAALSSCGIARVYLGVTQARNDYARGEFQQANRKLIDLRSVRSFEPWISFNLGTVYYALGEAASAAEIWSNTDVSASDELGFRIEFNLGVLDFERGAFREAATRFRRALEIDSSSIEAKVNLELALEKIDDEREETSVPSDRVLPSSAAPEVDRLLQYVERLETNTWMSTGTVEPQEGVHDW